MRSIRTEQIKNGDILARDIYSSTGVILISAGTELKEAYRTRLMELHITDLFVEDEISRDILMEDITEEKISRECTEELRRKIERFSYVAGDELNQIHQIAQNVMNEVLKNKELIYSISNVRDYSRSLYEHLLSVGALSTLLAIQAGYEGEGLKNITIGALLHDIGFVNMKEDYRSIILNEAEEPVQKEIKRHVLYGYAAVEHQRWLSSVSKDIILYHHERLDGTGYPFRIPGERIRREVKLVSICDAFDNMVYGNLEKRKRVYEAMEYIVGMGGREFELELVQLFIQSVAAYPTGTLVLLNNGERGIVLRQNRHTPTRPIVRILKKNAFGNWERVHERNLTEELTIFIIETIEE